ncbi:MAG: transcription termination factor Rho [Lachnospiraceae bacterium]|nr:transcription termination factor Rho [Lachnospiraceae bacterium]MBQ6258910.1 transcription termination factor Rho [Lachnospiraceae bacterium]
MNREQYESLKAADIKAIAKTRGIKYAQSKKKEELIDLMVAMDEEEESKEESTSEEAGTEKYEESSEAAVSENSEAEQETEEKTEKESGKEPEKTEKEEKDGKEEKNEKKPPVYDDAKPGSGFLEVLSEGYGFLRSNGFMSGENDIYVSPSQIRRFNLKTGDIVTGSTRRNNPNDKFGALLYIDTINGMSPEAASARPNFENLTPIFPNKRIRLEKPGGPVSMRIVDMLSPIGMGQRGMIVSQPKAGKTTLLKQIATSVIASHPDMHIIILLIDERPEEVTDMKDNVKGDNVEIVYSTFDELPEHHKRVSEMVIERAKRLVEHGRDVMILLDSITRLARAYNLTVPPSGRTLSGGLDPAALHMPKRFFGAARNMKEGGSLTILATALVETGSKMDDVVFEEFKGTGNMELVLDRKLSEKRVFPAIDLARSSTRRDDLLFDLEEARAADILRKALVGLKKDEATEAALHLFTHTRSNRDFVDMVIKKNGVF